MSNSDEEILIVPDNIPDDLVYEILLHLPIVSILRFRSVCRSWLALLSSPSFAKSQLAATTKATPPSDDRIRIAHTYEYEEESNTTIVLVDMASRQIVADLHFPFSPDEFPYMPYSEVVGSASGIVCVSCILHRISYIYLWNPATRMSKRINSLHVLKRIAKMIMGFGFDSISNDFKVVRVVSPSFSAQVYSANGDVWHNVSRDPTDFPLDENFNVCVNGFLCTAGTNGMIAFDLNKEVFNCNIKFPAPTFDESITQFDAFDPHARITEYNDSIAVIMCKRSEYDRKIDLWSLDDEACLRGGGVRASWTRRLNIIIMQPVQFVNGYFNGGDFLLLNDDVWYLYNPENEEADLCIPENEKARNFADDFFLPQFFRYTESLYNIPGCTQVNWNAREDDIEDDN